MYDWVIMTCFVSVVMAMVKQALKTQTNDADSVDFE